MALLSKEIFSFENYLDRSAATATSSDIATSSDVLNCLDPRLGLLTIFTAGTSKTIIFDCGSSVSIQSIALVGINLPSYSGDAGVVKITISANADLSSPTLAETTYNSQSIDTWVNLGAERNLFRTFLSAAVSGRYVRVKLEATGSFTPHVARAHVGPIWQASRGGVKAEGGLGFGLQDLSERRVSGADADLVFARAKRRSIRYAIHGLTRADAMDTLYPQFRYALGSSRDFLSALDASATDPTAIQFGTIWGSVTDGGPENPRWGSYDDAFTHSERLGYAP